ncbi:hypothetical protein GN958_ATG13222, partial [Phytophthora infestans]
KLASFYNRLLDVQDLNKNSTGSNLEMRFGQLPALAVVALILCCSAVVTADSTALKLASAKPGAIYGGHRYLKGSKTSTGLDAANEERVGATTPSFKQYFSWIKLPKLSGIPGFKQLRGYLVKRDAARVEKLRQKLNNNPGAYGY